MSPDHVRTLESLAHDTGGFRVSNKQAADIAAACAAALKLHAQMAELIAAANEIKGGHGMAVSRLRAALAAAQS